MNKELLSILACPRCHEELELKEENSNYIGLVCEKCLVMYPIRDDIPIMLLEEAIPLNNQEKQLKADS